MADAQSAAYLLGYTEAEAERLARQAARFREVSERAFRTAGIAAGQRVLDVGSGAGDVSLLLRHIVGPAGEVVGVEQSAESIAWAQRRVSEAGFANVRYVQGDVASTIGAEPFDAVAGRFILMFVPDPVAALRSLKRQLKPGGIVAFLEVSWHTTLKLSEHLPLWYAGVKAIHETLLRSESRPEMGLELYQAFVDAGLPAPTMHLDTMLGDAPEVTRWVSDLIQSMLPKMRAHGVSTEELGDLSTLAARQHAEIETARTVVPNIGIVSAWCCT